jgi:transcriptional regulator with XRE-family HTH domain
LASAAERLRILRDSLDITQPQMALMAGVSQSAINRYEHGHAEAPYRVLVWYADYFDVSLDYILGRCDEPQGKLYCYRPEAVREKFNNQELWHEFVEMCFDPASSLNARLKEMILRLATEENSGLKTI